MAKTVLTFSQTGKAHNSPLRHFVHDGVDELMKKEATNSFNSR